MTHISSTKAFRSIYIYFIYTLVLGRDRVDWPSKASIKGKEKKQRTEGERRRSQILPDDARNVEKKKNESREIVE
jgi:hypothetical protein